jgi:hypothetical protein
MALTALVEAGYISHVATQNVDGLHRRAGCPLDKLSELHGNVCLEVCQACGLEYLRDDDVGGVGLKATGNICDGCGGALHDFVLDWDDALPVCRRQPAPQTVSHWTSLRLASESQVPHVKRTERRARRAAAAICLGTSLRIKPVGDMPLLALGWEFPDSEEDEGEGGGEEEEEDEEEEDDDDEGVSGGDGEGGVSRRPGAADSSEEEASCDESEYPELPESERQLVIVNMQRTPLDKCARGQRAPTHMQRCLRSHEVLCATDHTY